jgi:hypothetical protein
LIITVKGAGLRQMKGWYRVLKNEMTCRLSVNLILAIFFFVKVAFGIVVDRTENKKPAKSVLEISGSSLGS